MCAVGSDDWNTEPGMNRSRKEAGGMSGGGGVKAGALGYMIDLSLEH